MTKFRLCRILLMSPLLLTSPQRFFVEKICRVGGKGRAIAKKKIMIGKVHYTVVLLIEWTLLQIRRRNAHRLFLVEEVSFLRGN